MSAPDYPVIAIDGGGSKTLAALCDMSDPEGSSAGPAVSAGPVNPNDVGEEEAAGRISSLCGELIRAWRGEHPGYRGGAVIYAGISGATGHSDAIERSVAQALESEAGRVRITVRTDSFNLFGFLPEDADCAVVIAGTGSVCFLRKNGTLSRIGGWGYLIDGESGGGFRIGSAGLEAALMAADGRGEKTSLSAAAAAYLGGPAEAPESTMRIYGGGKPFIAGFAPCVFEASAAGDAAARRIVRGAARGIAELLAAALREAGSEEMPLPTVCSGGLFCEEEFRAAFGEALKEAGVLPRVEVRIPDTPQLDGAVRVAKRFALKKGKI